MIKTTSNPHKQSFLRNQNGNVAMMFAALILPIVAACGLAVDMFRVNGYRTEIREAADAGVLAAARAKTLKPSMTEADMSAVARTHIEANLKSLGQFDIKSITIVFDKKTGDTSLVVKSDVDTLLLGIVGKQKVSFNTAPKARVVPPKALEIALILDNTYSMKGAKLLSLKSAAKDLVETIMVDSSTDVSIGIVPFSQYVNVGISRRNESWIDVDADWSKDYTSCWNTYPDRTESNCTTTKKTCSRTKDGVYEEWQCNKKKCDVVKGKKVKKCKEKTKKYVFRGCVGSRDNPYNVQDDSYGTRKVPGFLNLWCTRELTPLTDKKSKILSEINKMSVQGSYTYIPAGLTWGYRLLSPEAPFDEGISYQDVADEKGIKSLVLMTDGENTASPSYPKHSKKKISVSNKLVTDICDEAKSKGIIIYTIAFEVNDNDIKDRLEDCASNSSNFFDADNSDALSEAFGSIALSMTELALTH